MPNNKKLLITEVNDYGTFASVHEAVKQPMDRAGEHFDEITDPFNKEQDEQEQGQCQD